MAVSIYFAVLLCLNQSGLTSPGLHQSGLTSPGLHQSGLISPAPSKHSIYDASPYNSSILSPSITSTNPATLPSTPSTSSSAPATLSSAPATSSVSKNFCLPGDNFPIEGVKDATFYTNTALEVAVVLLSQLITAVGAGVPGKFSLVVLDDNNTQIAFMHLPDLLPLSVIDLQRKVNVGFNQTFLFYNKVSRKHETLWISKQCSELPEHYSSKCGVAPLPSQDSVINIPQSLYSVTNIPKFVHSRILMLHNLNGLAVKNVAMNPGNITCYCKIHPIQLCSCNEPRDLVYIVLALASRASVYVELSGGAMVTGSMVTGDLVTVTINTWSVSKIISAPLNRDTTLQTHVFKPDTLYLILIGMHESDIDCWASPAQPEELTHRTKAEDDHIFLNIASSKDETYFVYYSVHHDAAKITIETTNSEDIISHACFSTANVSGCVELVSYNSVDKVMFTDNHNAKVPDAEVTQTILFCVEDLVILCAPETLRPPLHPPLFKYTSRDDVTTSSNPPSIVICIVSLLVVACVVVAIVIFKTFPAFKLKKSEEHTYLDLREGPDFQTDHGIEIVCDQEKDSEEYTHVDPREGPGFQTEHGIEIFCDQEN